MLQSARASHPEYCNPQAPFGQSHKAPTHMTHNNTTTTTTTQQQLQHHHHSGVLFSNVNKFLFSPLCACICGLERAVSS